MSINQPNFPNKIWDGFSPSRHDRTIDRPPDGEDWDQIIAEIIALQQPQGIETAWINMDLLGLWTLNLNNSNNIPQYKKIGNKVLLRGIALFNEFGFIDSVIAQLPLEYSPKNVSLFHRVDHFIVSNFYVHNLEIRPNGEIYTRYFGGSINYPLVSLEGISYFTD
jgi:hypothetical protein